MVNCNSDYVDISLSLDEFIYLFLYMQSALSSGSDDMEYVDKVYFKKILRILYDKELSLHGKC